MMKSHFRIQNDEEEVVEEIESDEEIVVQKLEEEHVESSGYRKLDKHEISVRLSWLGKTADGEGYTYLQAICTGMMLTDVISLQLFTYLQFVNLSHNHLTIEGLQAVTKLPYLILIQADHNYIVSANLEKCKYLQVIILNNNRIQTVEDVFQPELSTLEVGHNEIMEIKFINRMPNLRVLDFRYNVIHSLTDMNFPNLDSLYLAGNKIKLLTGIETLQNLRILHVRNNPIRLLDGFETKLPKLEYLNLRNCKVNTLKQIKKLRPQSALRTLILKGTLYMGGTGKEDPEAANEEEDPEQRVEVLAALPVLTRLNKAEFTDEERTEAKDLMTVWLEEGENDEEEVVEELPEEEAAMEEHNIE